MQDFAAILIATAAAVWLVRRAVRRLGGTGCGPCQGSRAVADGFVPLATVRQTATRTRTASTGSTLGTP